MPPQPITDVTDQMFLTESDIFKIVETYFCHVSFSYDKLNDWMGKDGAQGVAKQKRLLDQKLRGRDVNLVKEELRGTD